MMNYTAIEVSVPYRGATFLNIVGKPQRQRKSMFPSPIGELHFSIEKCLVFQRLRSEFPSPIGELHFSMNIRLSLSRVQHCFRPLSGSYISQFFFIFFSLHRLTFPSPIGELHFSISVNTIQKSMNLRFRPLSGSYISQFDSTRIQVKAVNVSVPYRGATFLNQYNHRQGKPVEQLFPSPIGELHFSIIRPEYQGTAR